MATWTSRIPRPFLDLIRSLGVVQPPDGLTFDLTGNVVPVAIVAAPTLAAISTTQTLNVGVTAGEQVNPPAGTLLADTGPLAAGTYSIMLMLGTEAAGGVQRAVQIQRRDAANAANIWSQLLGFPIHAQIYSIRFILAASERLRVVMGPAGSAATERYQAQIFF